jgi:hypothetical protein
MIDQQSCSSNLLLFSHLVLLAILFFSVFTWSLTLCFYTHRRHHSQSQLFRSVVEVLEGDEMR